MKNLIQMDFYRLFRTKALKIGIIAAFLVSIFNGLFTMLILALVKDTVASDPSLIATMGLVVPSVGWIVGVDFADIVISGTGAFSLLIACMVSASFISGEQSCGYVKNVMGQISDRGYTVVSKFVVTSSVYFLILAIYTAVNLVFAGVCFSEYVVSYSIGTLIGALLTRFLLYVAINAIIVFLCILTKSQSLAMVIGAIFGIGVTQIAYMIGNGLLGMLKIDINLSHIMPDGINGLINATDIDSLYLRAFVVSAVIIFCFLAGSVLVVKNRDVR